MVPTSLLQNSFLLPTVHLPVALKEIFFMRPENILHFFLRASFFLAKYITDKYNISITRIEGDLLAKIIDFNEAKRKMNEPVLNELHELYDNLTTMDMDAAFRYQFNLPGGNKEDAKKLDILMKAFRTNPTLRNIGQALGK